MPLEVTNEFLDENKTARGAWTRAQTDALGIDWPLAHGWKAQVIGKTITDAQAETFIRGSGVFRPRTVRKERKRIRREGRIEAIQRELAELRERIKALEARTQ